MQQISLSQKVTEAKMNGVEAKMDGLEAKMDVLEVNIEDFKKYMEGLKGGLAKLLQEMFPNGEKVVEETHDEKKRNVSHDFIDSNIGLKNHHVPKINMRNFDGKDHVAWILQMEQYLDFHNVQKHKRYAFQLYIWNLISLYGIDGLSLVKTLSLGQFLQKK